MPSTPRVRSATSQELYNVYYTMIYYDNQISLKAVTAVIGVGVHQHKHHHMIRCEQIRSCVSCVRVRQ
jgi:hypothetical protein